MSTIHRSDTVRGTIAKLFLDWRASAVSSAALDTPRRSMSIKSLWIFRGVEIGCAFYSPAPCPIGAPPCTRRCPSPHRRRQAAVRGGRFRLDRRHPLPTVTDRTTSGGQMHALVEQLYPLCRSITGDGLRATLEVLAE